MLSYKVAPVTFHQTNIGQKAINKLIPKQNYRLCNHCKIIYTKSFNKVIQNTIQLPLNMFFLFSTHPLSFIVMTHT